MGFLLPLFCLVGLSLSGYGTHIHLQMEQDPFGYQPACKFDHWLFSSDCAKVLSSEYGKHFGVYNTIWGLLFYSGLIILTFLKQFKLVKLAAAASVVGSVYLAYHLYLLSDFCILCAGIYLTNVLILGASHS